MEAGRFGFRSHPSLVASNQREPANYNPLYKPQSGAIRYLTGPEITYPGVDLANFLNSFCRFCRIHILNNLLSNPLALTVSRISSRLQVFTDSPRPSSVVRHRPLPSLQSPTVPGRHSQPPVTPHRPLPFTLIQAIHPQSSCTPTHYCLRLPGPSSSVITAVFRFCRPGRDISAVPSGPGSWQSALRALSAPRTVANTGHGPASV